MASLWPRETYGCSQGHRKDRMQAESLRFMGTVWRDAAHVANGLGRAAPNNIVLPALG